MARHPRPRDRSKVANSGSDTFFFLKLDKRSFGKRCEVLGGAVNLKFLCSGTGILRDKEDLKSRYVGACHAKPEITGKGG